jgi:endogenous inhibitor of DNA gyrase (YacG/DUF329 family)
MGTQPQAPVKRVPCPHCGTPAPFGPQNRWRPFCSERCRSLDLGAWASEQYRMPTRPSEDDETPDTPPEDPRG